MRELKTLEVPVLESKPNTRTHRMSKRWKAAQNVSNGRNKNINFMVELYYKQLLEFAKDLLSTLPDAYSRSVFEKDSREDNSENCFTMHSFISPSFCWLLECDLSYAYRVEYDFYNCPFEYQIRAMIERLEPYNKYFGHWPLKPNCEEYLERVFEVQGEQYTFVL